MRVIEQEFGILVSAFLTGILVSAVYGAIRVWRRLFRHSLFWVSMEDLIYWVWFGIYVFTELHRTCSGRIRWYYLLGMGTGMFFAGNVICKFIKNKIDKLKKTR